MSVHLKGDTAERLFINGDDVSRAYTDGQLIFLKSTDPLLRLYMSGGNYDVTNPLDLVILNDVSIDGIWTLTDATVITGTEILNIQIFNQPGWPATIDTLLGNDCYFYTPNLVVTYSFVVPDDITTFAFNLSCDNIDIDLNNANISAHVNAGSSFDFANTIINKITVNLSTPDLIIQSKEVVINTHGVAVVIAGSINTSKITEINSTNNDISITGVLSPFIGFGELGYSTTIEYLTPNADLIISGGGANYNHNQNLTMICKDLTVSGNSYRDFISYDITITGALVTTAGSFVSRFQTTGESNSENIGGTIHALGTFGTIGDYHVAIDTYNEIKAEFTTPDDIVYTRNPSFVINSDTVISADIPRQDDSDRSCTFGEPIPPTYGLTIGLINDNIREFTIVPLP